jgi:hypothetical protein
MPRKPARFVMVLSHKFRLKLQCDPSKCCGVESDTGGSGQRPGIRLRKKGAHRSYRSLVLIFKDPSGQTLIVRSTLSYSFDLDGEQKQLKPVSSERARRLRAELLRKTASFRLRFGWRQVGQFKWATGSTLSRLSTIAFKSPVQVALVRP